MNFHSIYFLELDAADLGFTCWPPWSELNNTFASTGINGMQINFCGTLGSILLTVVSHLRSYGWWSLNVPLTELLRFHLKTNEEKGALVLNFFFFVCLPCPLLHFYNPFLAYIFFLLCFWIDWMTNNSLFLCIIFS